MISSEKQQGIIDEFSSIDGWEDRYKKIISLGKELPALDDKDKLDEHKVKGCQSQVWLLAELQDGKVIFRADSDALIVKGLVSLLLRAYSGLTPQEILATPPDFIEKIGFSENLSPSRTNGLFSMIKQMKNYAIVFQHMQKTN